jgi:hypothetical protein
VGEQTGVPFGDRLEESRRPRAMSARPFEFPHGPSSPNVEAHQALPRPLTPDDTAGVVALLVRDEAGALICQTIMIDGGLVMR